MQVINDLFSRTFFNNYIGTWLIALALAIILVFILRLIRNFLANRISRLAGRTQTHFDDFLAEIVSQIRLMVILVVSIYLASQILILSEAVRDWIQGILFVVVLLQVAISGNVVIGYLVRRYVQIEVTDETRRVLSTTALTFISKLVLWSLILLVALDNLGVDITALVASLGIGGIAIALAAQNILGDLFASLSIMFDKPFVLGDFIIVGEQLGTVERIGLKTTRVRSLHGEQLIFSNSDLLNSRIRNFKRMFERRVLFGIGVTYQTPYEKLVRIPVILREVIEKEERARFDRAHFKEYGDFSLNFEIVYWVKDPDYNVYMDIQQAINLDIYRLFQQEGIEFAYPTQTLYVSPEGSAPELVKGTS